MTESFEIFKVADGLVGMRGFIAGFRRLIVGPDIASLMAFIDREEGSRLANLVPEGYEGEVIVIRR